MFACDVFSARPAGRVRISAVCVCARPAGGGRPGRVSASECIMLPVRARVFVQMCLRLRPRQCVRLRHVACITVHLARSAMLHQQTGNYLDDLGNTYLLS